MVDSLPRLGRLAGSQAGVTANMVIENGEAPFVLVRCTIDRIAQGQKFPFGTGADSIA